MFDREAHRAIRSIVWGGRATGWVLITLAIFNVLPFRFVGPQGGSFKLLSSLTLGLLGIACLVGLEIVLRSFDRHFSRN
jgi:hypothetical protein